MREPVSSTIDPPPPARGQIRGVPDWRALVPADKAAAKRIKTEQTARAKQAAATAEQQHAARLREIGQLATWPRHASSDTTPRTTTRVVPRRTESGRRFDVVAIYRRFNNEQPSTTAPAPARFRDLAQAAYGESASSGASLVSSSARGGR